MSKTITLKIPRAVALGALPTIKAQAALEPAEGKRPCTRLYARLLDGLSDDEMESEDSTITDAVAAAIATAEADRIAKRDAIRTRIDADGV